MGSVIATGVDGARGGWMAARALDDGTTSVAFVKTFAEADAHDAPLAVDMPIGLPEEVGFRACDRVARERLGDRRSCVFAPPPRWLLDAADFAEVQRRVAERGGAGLSRQSFGLAEKVREVDAHVRNRSDDRIVEAHPELCFLVLNQGEPLAPKATPEGREQRRMLVEARFPDAPEWLERARGRLGDALDAYAVLTAALSRRHGDAEVLGDGEVDAAGLPMRMVVPRDAAPPRR